MTDSVLSALIAEGAMIIQDYSGAYESKACTTIHFDEVKGWQKKAALFIGGRSPTLASQIRYFGASDSSEKHSRRRI